MKEKDTPTEKDQNPAQPEEAPREKSKFKELISWSTADHDTRERSGNWYFVLWTVAIAGAAISVIIGNLLFALIVVIGAFTLSVYASKPPREVHFSITDRGVMADGTFLPYSSLNAFWIDEVVSPRPLLLLEPKKVLATLYLFPIDDSVDLDRLRAILIDHLKEEEIEVPLGEVVMNKLGF